MVKSRENLLGAYAFLIGVVLAVTLGLFRGSTEIEYASGIFYSILVIIGVIVGFMNVSDKNSSIFLFASLSMVIVGALGNQPLMYVAGNNYVVTSLRNILDSLLILFIPATIIVSLKTVFALAKV